MFVTEKPALSDALAIVKDVVKSKNKYPILSNVLIERDGDMLTARASDRSLEISTRFAATIGEDFQPFTCPAHTFADIVRNAPEDRIAINAILQAGIIASIQIKSGRSKLKLPVLPASDFPKLDAGSLKHQMSLAASTLQKALQAVEYAAETEASRYYICGVHLEPGKDGLTLVATDGKRLVKRIIAAIEFDQDDISGIPSVTVPNDTVDRIIKLLDGRDDVTVELSEQKIRVAAGGTVLNSQLVDGNFPAYRQIIPAPSSYTSRFSGKALSDAVGRLLTVTPDAGNGILFNFTNETIALMARDISAGEGEDEVPAETDGEIRTGFHGRHLREALAHNDGDSFELLVGQGASPALLRAAGDLVNYTILMPMQVKGMLGNG